MEIYKYRSVRRCLGDAYTTITEHLGDVTRKTWLPMALGAITLSLTTYFFLPNKALHDWGVEHEVASFATQTLVYAATAVCCLLALAASWRAINGRRWRVNVARVLLSLLVACAIACLFVAASSLLARWLLSVPASPAGEPTEGGVSITWAFSLLGLALVAIACCVPLYYTLTRLMMERHWLPFRGYGRGFRYWGTIFVTTLLSCLLAVVTLAVVALPAVILVTAQLYSQLGALGGDPPSTPGYFTPLLLAALALLYFAACYVALWAALAATYLYGSIETQQAEKTKHDREENQAALDRP